MQHVSAWRRAGSHLATHWVRWLGFLLATFAIGWLMSLLMQFLTGLSTPLAPFGTPAVLTRATRIMGALATIVPVYLAVGSFMTAAELSLLKAAADASEAPTFASYFRGGWAWWSWTWRGIGFAIVLGLALYLSSSIIGVLGTLIPVAGVIVVIALVLAWILVIVPVGVWAWIAGFYFRPAPYWSSLRRAWQAFRVHPGPMLGPIYAVAGVSIVVLGPAFVPMYFSMQVAVLHPGVSPALPLSALSPILILPSLILSAFELWALLTIVIRIREWRLEPASDGTPPTDVP